MSTTTQALLENYTAAVQARNDHIAQNQQVFDAHQQIVFRVIDAENALRDAVAESGEPVQNSEFAVKITETEQQVCDFDALAELVSPEVYAKVVKVEKRPARITISPIR